MSNLPRPTAVDFVRNPKPFESTRTQFKRWLVRHGYDITKLSQVEVEYLIVVFNESLQVQKASKAAVDAAWYGHGVIEVPNQG